MIVNKHREENVPTLREMKPNGGGRRRPSSSSLRQRKRSAPARNRGGLPSCASAKYKYYSNGDTSGGAYHSPSPARNGGFQFNSSSSSLREDFLRHLQTHENTSPVNHRRISSDQSFLSSDQFKKIYRRRSFKHTGKISTDGQPVAVYKGPTMQRSISDPNLNLRNLRVLYDEENDVSQQGFWVKLKRSQSDELHERAPTILRKNMSRFRQNDDYLDRTAADNLANSTIRFNKTLSHVTFVMEDKNIVMCVEETKPLIIDEDIDPLEQIIAWNLKQQELSVESSKPSRNLKQQELSVESSKPSSEEESAPRARFMEDMLSGETCHGFNSDACRGCIVS